MAILLSASALGFPDLFKLRNQTDHFFFIGWLAEAAWLVLASGHALGAVFNQLVRSRAQLLVAE